MQQGKPETRESNLRTLAFNKMQKAMARYYPQEMRRRRKKGTSTSVRSWHEGSSGIWFLAAPETRTEPTSANRETRPPHSKDLGHRVLCFPCRPVPSPVHPCTNPPCSLILRCLQGKENLKFHSDMSRLGFSATLLTTRVRASVTPSWLSNFIGTARYSHLNNFPQREPLRGRSHV